MLKDAENASAQPYGQRTHKDIRRRLDFMRLDEAALAGIRSLKAIVDRELPVALDKFYDQLRKTPEVRRFFPSDQHIARAKGAQQGHWNNISGADFNEDYAAKVQTIGSIHARIGLEPQWYIGGYAIILDHLIQQAVRQALARPGFFARPDRTAPDFGAALASLVKAALMDMELAISVYIDEAEIRKQEAQAEAIARERRLISEVFGKAMSAVADKDLQARIGDDLPEAYQGLREDFNRALDHLGETVSEISSSARQIETGSAQMRSCADDLARRTERQAASLEETAAALEEITSAVKASSTRADQAGRLVARARNGAQTSGEIVERAIAAMGAIENSSKEITSIIGVIDEIAFQTNLLALNAGVEAARAGDAGKGFAVVAQEVRELAQRSARAAKEIKALITTSSEQVQAGVSLVGETGKALATIVSEVSEIDLDIVAIVESTREQAASLAEVNAAVNTLDQGTQQNAAMAEETNASSRVLAQEVLRISDMLRSFHVADTAFPARHGDAARQGAA